MTTEISSYWRLADELSAHDAACLIIGIDPEDTNKFFEWVHDHDRNLHKFKLVPTGYTATRNALLVALRTKAIEGLYHQDYDANHQWTDVSECYVSVSSLKEWLSRKGFKNGFFFPDSKPDIDYLDKNHPHYSPKLAAAITVWQAISRDEKYHNNGKTIKQNLINWLTPRAAEFNLIKEDGEINSLAIKDQIAMVSNWDTSGGAATTPT